MSKPTVNGSGRRLIERALNSGFKPGQGVSIRDFLSDRRSRRKGKK